MRLTNAGDYGVRAVLDIARHHPEVRTNRQITAAMDLPRNFTSQILAILVRHGTLDSSTGPVGGYTLARPPAEISLLEVIEGIEGPVAAGECFLGGGSCGGARVCPLHETWSDATSAFRSRLAGTTLEDLADIDRSIRSGTYRPPDHVPLHSTSPLPRDAGDQPLDSPSMTHPTKTDPVPCAALHPTRRAPSVGDRARF